ncbi:calcium binding protein 2 [Plakobranchus ocellatus]|uniref:Calcium binding protein 2 n=1 Tax=Plakobranchus ocellatus TaxID=259542 RepID=A0AAV4BH29_9GAST|nr:calcium binding protein 2 [Plakobranchus ocellatus]
MGALYFLLLTLPALTLAIDLKPYNETAHMMFIESDQDSDGIFTRDEMDIVFKGYDINGDGRVTRHEYTSYVDLHTPTLHALSHALYDIYDSDKDHHLDHHDYDNLFAMMDKDNDGIVQEMEFRE